MKTLNLICAISFDSIWDEFLLFVFFCGLQFYLVEENDCKLPCVVYIG